MGEQILAGLAVAVCAVLLLRLCVGERLRFRFDLAVRRAWNACRRVALRLWHWRSSRRSAARIAEEAIERARRGVERDGNVYKPKSFRRPRKPH